MTVDWSEGAYDRLADMWATGVTPERQTVVDQTGSHDD